MKQKNESLDKEQQAQVDQLNMLKKLEQQLQG